MDNNSNKQVLFRPSELYENQLRQQYHDCAEQYFDKLGKDANINVAANKLQNDKIRKIQADLEAEQKKGKKTKSAGSFQVFLGVILLIFSVFLFLLSLILNKEDTTAFALILTLAIVFLAGGIALLIYRGTANKKKAKALEESEADAQKRWNEEVRIAQKQLASLNASFDWNMPARVMEKTTPIIDLDPYFSMERLTYLAEKFGVGEVTDENYSVLNVLSGNIQGNPFLVEKLLSHRFAPKTYVGHRIITWTTTYTDSKGHMHVNHHSETLTAYSTHNAPFYSDKTLLIYGNEAAPHLSFTHEISDANKLKDENEIEKYVEKKNKEIQKMADDALQEGRTFTPMGNEKFDCFFGAFDRDNEVEFRLLFTPLAQNNMLDLMFSKPFGDDFVFRKDKMVNIIYSEHSQKFDYDADPTRFECYDFEEGRKRFVDYCDAFIANLFFDLAPLLSIPLYQMYKPHEEIYKESLPHNYTSFEAESMANRLPRSCFLPQGADSSLPVMEKFRSAKTCAKTDKDEIFSYSYATIQRVDHISVRGGDGYYHDVPVPWIEYIRRERITPMELKDIGSNREKVNEAMAHSERFNTIARGKVAGYAKGLLALVGGDLPFEEKDDKTLDDIFSSL